MQRSLAMRSYYKRTVGIKMLQIIFECIFYIFIRQIEGSLCVVFSFCKKTMYVRLAISGSVNFACSIEDGCLITDRQFIDILIYFLIIDIGIPFLLAFLSEV